MDVLKSKNKNWWNTLSQNEKNAIEQGLKDAESGKLNPHDKARSLYEKWL